MKIYILRAAASGSGWRLRYAIQVENPVDALITTVQIGPVGKMPKLVNTETGNTVAYVTRIPLADALLEGAKLAQHNFEAIMKFNEGAE